MYIRSCLIYQWGFILDMIVCNLDVMMIHNMFSKHDDVF